MTVLVGTSAWIEYLRGTGSPRSGSIREAIRADVPLAWTEPTLYELTASAGSPRRAGELRARLLRGPLLALDGLQDGEDAARLYRSARSKGLAIRSGIDRLIAAVALRTEGPVRSLDRDLDALPQVSGLVLEWPEP